MHTPMALALMLALAAGAACATAARMADPASDAPEARFVGSTPVVPAAHYRDALTHWRSADEVNAWIGARFQYDMARALQLSESQRARSGRVAIHPPEAFYDTPHGVCVDLARFAVETLRSIAPDTRPTYLMIEFAPVTVQGQTLRRHWVAQFERDGSLYYFADSKRPGHMAGPYASAAEFIRDYAAYRGREIVAFSERVSTEKQMRTLAVRQVREPQR